MDWCEWVNGNYNEVLGLIWYEIIFWNFCGIGEVVESG
jgi:hypothetical protein